MSRKSLRQRTIRFKQRRLEYIELLLIIMGLDYYAVLNVPRKASLAEIKLGYRKWAIATHPHRKNYPQHPENPPEGIFKECEDKPLSCIPSCTYWEYVNEAYDVLSNPLTRQVFDVYGEEGLKRGVPAPNGYIQPYVYHRDYMKTFNYVIGTTSPYADLIDAVIHPPVLYQVDGCFGVKQKDPDIEKLVYLDLKDVYFGGIKKMKISRLEFIDESKTKTEKRDKILVIAFSPGVLAGTHMRFTEEGDQGPTKIPADIVFITADKPHDLFLRCDCNLSTVYEIDLKQSLCGVTLKLATIDNRKLVVSITDVIAPDFVKVVKGEGLPLSENCTIKGDLYIQFKIVFPKYITKTTKEKLSSIFDNLDVDDDHKSPEYLNKMILADKLNRMYFRQ